MKLAGHEHPFQKWKMYTTFVGKHEGIIPLSRPWLR
jgi:hypothetical protein